MGKIILLEEKKYTKGVALLKIIGDAVVQDGKVVAKSNMKIRNKVDAHTFKMSVQESFNAAGYQVIWE